MQLNRTAFAVSGLASTALGKVAWASATDDLATPTDQGVASPPSSVAPAPDSFDVVAEYRERSDALAEFGRVAVQGLISCNDDAFSILLSPAAKRGLQDATASEIVAELQTR